jgi:hypothetical protein
VRQQEGNERASALADARLWLLQDRLVYVPSHSRSDDARHTRPYRRTKPLVEADETLIGGKKKNRAFAKKEPKKHTVLTLVDRDGDSHSFHIANVKAKTLRETIVKVASRKSYLATDELVSYERIGKEFSGHGAVNHSADEFSRLGGFIHVNTAECAT